MTPWIVAQTTAVTQVTQEALTAKLDALVMEVKGASAENTAVRPVTVEIETGGESASPVMCFCQQEQPKLFHR